MRPPWYELLYKRSACAPPPFRPSRYVRCSAHLFITDTNYPRFYVKGLCIKTQALACRRAEVEGGVRWGGAGSRGRVRGIRSKDRWPPSRERAKGTTRGPRIERGGGAYYSPLLTSPPYPTPCHAPPALSLKINYALTRVLHFSLLITISSVFLHVLSGYCRL